jgi:hypothetical protein
MPTLTAILKILLPFGAHVISCAVFGIRSVAIVGHQSRFLPATVSSELSTAKKIREEMQVDFMKLPFYW